MAAKAYLVVRIDFSVMPPVIRGPPRTPVHSPA